MPTLRHVLLPLLALPLLTGCAAATPNNTSAPLLLKVHPGPGADRIFAYLQLEQAMRHDDVTGVQEAAQSLLHLDPQSRPLADASGWLLGNRYSEQARGLLEASVAALPDDLQLRIMLAETMLDEGDADGGVKLLQNFANAHPDHTAARVELALLYLRADRASDALVLLERLPDSERTPSVRYYHAQALKSAGRLGAAADMLRSALAEAPDFMEAMLELALVEEERGRFASARALYDKLLTFDEGNQDILLRLVVVSLKEGNPERAYKIASSMPDSFGFVVTATTLFMDEGRYDLAATLLAMLAKNPDTPREIALYQAVVAYENGKNTAAALQFLDHIPSSNRQYLKARKLRMQILYESGDPNAALDTVVATEQAFPEEQDLRYAHMEMLMAQKRFAEARTVAEEAMRVWPDDADLAFQHAYLVDTGGDKARALELMEGVAERWPDNAQALNYIGYTLADENRDLDRALVLLTRAVELSPETDYMLDSLAWVHYRLGHYPEAWEHIRHAISLLPPDRPQDSTMWEHYGDIARAMQLSAEARRGWTRALELKPDDPNCIRRKMEQL